MKKSLLYIFSVILALSACDDDAFLNSSPHDSMTIETFWNSEKDALGALLDCYSSGFVANQSFKECRSDNSIQMYAWMDEGTRNIADGTITPFTTVTNDTWINYYKTIRKCNFFLENIDKVPFKTDELKERMIAEVRFIRAYTYLYAAFDFGDIPLVEKTLTVEESKQVTITSQDKIFKYVVDEAKACTAVLKANYPTTEFGRITKGACLALVARTYLFQNDYNNLLQAITELEDLGKYSLYTTGDEPYADLFGGPNQRNNEVILPVLRAEKTGKLAAGHSANAACLLKNIAGEDPYVTIFPAGSLADAYPMADGRLIHEAGSTYDPKNPYSNRDPRLTQSIICPGNKIGRLVGDAVVWDLTYDPEDINSQPSFRYDFRYTSVTGFVWKKVVDWSVWGMKNVWNCKNDVILMRWADVLLMKAEAMAEISGTGKKEEICDIIDQLRDRCKGGKVYRANYNSKEDLVDLVRNERRVELANEGLRYFDLIRWKLAEKDPVTAGSGLNGDMYGAYMRLDGVGKDDKCVIIDGAARRYVEKRIFDASKRYLLPIPQQEIDFNSNLKQNPNW